MVLPDPKIEGATSPEQIHRQVAATIETHLQDAGTGAASPVIPVTADTHIDLSNNKIEIVTDKQAPPPAPPKKENRLREFWLEKVKPWFYPVARSSKSNEFLKTGISRQVEKVENQ